MMSEQRFLKREAEYVCNIILGDSSVQKLIVLHQHPLGALDFSLR